MPGSGALADSATAGQQGQDRSARCAQAGAAAPQWRFDAGVGARPGARGAAQPGARPRRGQSGRTARQTSLEQISAVPGSTSTERGTQLVQALLCLAAPVG